MTEMTPQIPKLINQLVKFSSNFFLLAAALISHGRAVDLLNIKSKFTKISKQK